MQITVTLNGTNENPWHKMGFKCNPFPQIPKAEAAAANRILRELDADPLTGAKDIRRIMQGCDKEFIDGCVKRFKPGERVRFVVEFPTPWDPETETETT